MNTPSPLPRPQQIQTEGSIRLLLSALYGQIASFDRELAAFGGSDVGSEHGVHPSDIRYARDCMMNYCIDLEVDLQRY